MAQWSGRFLANRFPGFMDNRSAAFLEVMIGIAVVGVLAFAVFLLAGRIRMATSAGAQSLNIRWPQLVLAVILLVVVALALLWQFPPLDGSSGLAAGGSWRVDPDSRTYFIIMLAIAGTAVLIFLAALMIRSNPQLAKNLAEEEDAKVTAPATVETPPSARLLGLALLVLAILLLTWIYLTPDLQFVLMQQVLYPVSLAVAVVMLFDKATRTWSAKNGGETFREWLLCDLMVFLLILGFLNLHELKAGEQYEAFLWDLIHLIAFFLVFWLLDRKLTRFRFLVAYLYLMLLPILLLIWRSAQNVETPGDTGWWGTIWPMFFLGVIFLVLELIAVVASSDREKQAVPSIKDALYVILAAITLIAAVPTTAAS